MYIHTYVHTYVRTYARTHARAHTHTYIHTYILYTHKYIHAYIIAYVHTYNIFMIILSTAVHSFDDRTLLRAVTIQVSYDAQFVYKRVKCSSCISYYANSLQ